MDYRDSAEEAEFRRSLAIWLRENRPEDWRHMSDPEERNRHYRAWHKALFAAGYLSQTWPIEFGGKGLSPVYDLILNEEIGYADCPPLPIIGHIGRALYLFGTDEQRARHLPGLLNGDVRWCQGFSEPDAGSDIASLRTRAVRDGDQYVVDGQKMWTSLAADSDWCLLLVRTDPELPKHQGITALLVSMRSPGVSVQRIRMSWGEAETCMVFFDAVEVPVEQRLGDEGSGWRMAMAALSHERGPVNQGYVATYNKTLRSAETAAVSLGRVGERDVRRQLALAYVRGEVLRLHALEQLSAWASTGGAGPTGSITKLLWSDVEQQIHHLMMDIWAGASVNGTAPGVFRGYLASRPASVYGGTSQIQRNILADKVLDMPRSRQDRPPTGPDPARTQ